MVYLRWILLYFEALSGLKVNLDKNAILPEGDVENIEQSLYVVELEHYPQLT